MNRPVVLFRKDLESEGEMEAANKHFPSFESRMQVPQNSLVVSRYSCLPFYRELEQDLAFLNSRMLNSYRQHSFVADIMEWAGPGGCLEGLTPRTWTEWGSLPEGAYVLKGRTNSRKSQWASRMFCPTKADIPRVSASLYNDTLISEQGIVIREYIPLKKLDEGLNGLPITSEWRTFWVVGSNGPVMLAKGYYWQYSHPEAGEKATWAPEADELVYKAADLVGEHVNFFVLDVAETEAGDWIIIEVNDGSMSGLCGCKADDLYGSLAKVFNR